MVPLIAVVCALVALLALWLLRAQFLARRAAQAEVARLQLALAGETEARARARFDAWRDEELAREREALERTAAEKLRVEVQRFRVEETKNIREDALKRQDAVVGGKITEHFVPYLPDFTYNPKDARFLGSPIDLIVFDGLDDGDVRRVVFIEVKTGSSSLSKRERLVRDAIREGRIEWIEFRSQAVPRLPAGGDSEP